MLSMHAAVVLLIALLIGVVVGLLTYLSAPGGLAAAVLAGFVATGVSIPVLRRLIGS